MTMTNTNTPSLINMPLVLTLGIFTDLQIREDLANDPGGYLDRNNPMAAVSPLCIRMLEECGELSSKFELDTPYSKRLVIHLVRKDSIVITVKYHNGLAAIEEIRVNVGLFLYGVSDYPVVESDVRAALSLLIEVVSPLLKDPLRDALGIVPGLEAGDTSRARFRDAHVCMDLPDVKAKDLLFGRGCRNTVCSDCYGNYLHDDQNFASIRIRDVDINSSSRAELHQDDPYAVRLVVYFVEPEWAGDRPNKSRVFSLRNANIAPRFHKTIMSLQAMHLPAPAGFRGEIDSAKLARAIAMNAALEGSECRLMNCAGLTLKSREASLKELKMAVAVEAARLNPVPMSELLERAYVRQAARRIHDFDWPIHPLISAVLG